MAERPRGLMSYLGGRVSHIRQGMTHTVCGLRTAPATMWRDEGLWDGQEREKICGTCRRILRQRALHGRAEGGGL